MVVICYVMLSRVWVESLSAMSQKRINLILGVHNHQPVDNWDHVIQDAYDKCYKPFMDVLEAHPKVGMSIHYTGYLLDWIADKHPSLIEQLRRLIDRGQVEMFTGGYYEPILAITPDSDKVGQIRRLTDRIEELTGARATGMWLAERVWEPHLVKPIAQAGVDYFCVDDAHFRAVGMCNDQLLGRYTSEEQGAVADILPVSQEMRYHIPYSQPEVVVDYLRSLATEDGQRAAIYFDDGEKFGVWPGTFQSVFGEKWLDRFFGALEAASDVINTTTPAQYVKATESLGRIYLPTASYSEMQEWALPAHLTNRCHDLSQTAAEDVKPFIRGGFWRHFLVKYPEANIIQKKMLHVSRKVDAAKDKLPAADAAKMQDHLWRGQSNDIFWHGVFGGLYLTNLRTANYQHLLQAETMADAVNRTAPAVDIIQTDFDCDGKTEVLLESPVQNLYLDPAEGGAMFELDYRPRHFNLLDTLQRRYEAYHDSLSKAVFEGDEQANSGEAKSIHDRVVTKERNLDKYLHYDWHPRHSLLDHFLGPDTTLDTLYTSKYAEQGDFVLGAYTTQVAANQVTLTREGRVWVDGQHQPIRVEKVVQVPSATEATTTITYTVTNLANTDVNLWFAPEFNVNLLAPDAPDRYYYLPAALVFGAGGGSATAVATHPSATKLEKKATMESKGEVTQTNSFGLADEWQQVDYQLHFSQSANVWRFPVHTISQSEAGFEKVYQGSALYPNWKINLAPNAQWTVTITQVINTVQAA
jgi:4-alpha-glucanotransferase